MAAAYYYRVSGKMALTIVTTGAGSTNAITGVMAAWMDSVPLLVISGNDKSSQYGVDGRGFGFQGYDSSEFARPCTKVAMRILKSDAPDRLLDICYKHALAPRQGPVWVDIPRDVQSHALA
jgi:acetolactate synthase-1/2/3 large subunit